MATNWVRSHRKSVSLHAKTPRRGGLTTFFNDGTDSAENGAYNLQLGFKIL
jgi:hypothetical protein